MPRVRLKINPDITGWSDSWNTHAIGEIIVTYDEGDASSEYVRDYEVLIGENWFPMDYAFAQKKLISSNLNDHFRESISDEEREHDYYD